MESSRAIILILALTAVLAVCTQPCAGNQKDDQNIFKEEDKGPGPGPGPERGPRRGGPGRGRFELTDEEVSQILKDLKERSPEKAKELEELRDKDPEKFQQELRRHAREEFGKIVRERIEKWRQQRQAEFIEWLQKSLPKEADELAKLKDRDPDLYGKKYDQAWRNYGRIFEESRRSPELSQILLDDFKLQKRTDELSAKIKAAGSNEREKKKLTAELEEVHSLRYQLPTQEHVSTGAAGWVPETRCRSIQRRVHQMEKEQFPKTSPGRSPHARSILMTGKKPGS